MKLSTDAEDAYDEGYEDGHKEGYELGYDEGWEAAKEEIIHCIHLIEKGEIK